METLEEVTLFQNGIKEEGMAGLLEGCKSAKNLRKLDLNDNWIKGEALKKLTELLQTHEKLSELNISDCNLGSEDNLAIVEAIEKSEKNWVSFGHDYNELNDNKLVVRLFEALAEGKKLKSLSLKGNEFEEEAREIIVSKVGKGEEEEQTNVCFESDDEDYDDEDPDKEFKEVLERFKGLSFD